LDLVWATGYPVTPVFKQGLGVRHRQPPLLVKNRLKELRATKDWSQAELAERLAVSRQTVNAIETERYDPSLPLALKIARLFKLAVETIFSD
jgi:putative transcriptional regulator